MRCCHDLCKWKEPPSLKTEELKAELDKRGLRQTGNKNTLAQRLLAAIKSEGTKYGVKDPAKDV